MTTRSRAARVEQYPKPTVDRGVQYLHDSVVEALGRFRATYRRTPSRSASQAYTDSLTKGRPVGTVTIGRLLLDGKANGACKMAALGVVKALESAVRMIWNTPVPSVQAALLAETEAEGKADLAELRVLSNPTLADIDRAIAAQQQELVAEQQLLEALVAARVERVTVKAAR